MKRGRKTQHTRAGRMKNEKGEKTLSLIEKNRKSSVEKRIF